MINYARWIGLPHETGADPDDGKAADCLVIARKVLVDQGYDFPALDPAWFHAAQQGDWRTLHKVWTTYMERTDAATPGSLCLYYNPHSHLGVGVFIDQGFLTVSHSRGVVWRPVALVKGTLWRLKGASV